MTTTDEFLGAEQYDVAPRNTAARTASTITAPLPASD